jgi:dTDP-4-dehydrorhamnose reductase
MPRDALIGHTGFVGGELARQRTFAATFNSGNIPEIRGGSFDTIICAGISAVKWMANKEPEKDWEGINRLLDCLSGVRAERFVLISTIDVYREAAGQTENDIPVTEGLHPYGLHRLKVEAFVREHFPVSTIVRLPALFGHGLKKNVLYDMRHLNQPENVVPNAAFQWYPTRRLTEDLVRITQASLDLINVTSEPVMTSEIHDRFFPAVTIGAPVAQPPRYDLRSIHDKVLGGHNGYHLSRAQVFEELALFVEAHR